MRIERRPCGKSKFSFDTIHSLQQLLSCIIVTVSCTQSMSPTYSQQNSDGGRLTLKSLKYIILPVWWSEEEGDTSFNVDPAQIEATYSANRQYYKDMSWNKMDVTYEILPQAAIGISKANPGMGNVQDETKLKVAEAGKVEGVDFDGISVAYWKADNGNLANGGGWGSVNGLFTWMTYPHNRESVTKSLLCTSILNKNSLCYIFSCRSST